MKFEPDEKTAAFLESLEVSHKIFLWDSGNSTKNLKHQVYKHEIEALFSRVFVLVGKIIEPYHEENRWLLLGQTQTSRKLTLIFTIRDKLIRPISCRPMRKEEKKIYEEIIARQTGGRI
jgi:uncharacterized DUF497 family protein